jgi:DNA-binding CsgD family transcriptional regulator
MQTMKRFSDALLNLQLVARASSIDRYQHDALSVIQHVVPFEKAWWGIMSAQGPSYRLHSAHPYNLPADFEMLWEDTKSDDALAHAVSHAPQQTVYFDQCMFNQAPGLATLMGEHEIGQALCTSVYLPSETAFVFLSLYREHGEPKFSADERMMNQYLMPHLTSFWEANRIAQLDYMKTRSAQERVPMAIVDRQFQVLNADDEFFDILRREWPAWAGGDLPRGLVTCLRSPSAEGVFKLTRVVGRRYFLDEFCVVALRERQCVDLLSKREHEVAKAFSKGDSYKEIARNMDIAPATVRHYLRVIYEKLEVGDKAQMGLVLNRADIFFEDKALSGRYQALQRSYHP